MTLDLHAQVAGRGRSELDRFSAPASGRRMASRRPRARRAPVTAISVLMVRQPAPASAAYQVWEKAHAAAAPPACDRPSGAASV